MTTPTPVDDKPTLKHWVIGFAVALFLNIGAPLLVAAATSAVHP